MDSTVLVMAPLEAGQRVVKELDARGLDIRAAFWWLSADSDPDSWQFVIATPLVEKRGPRKVLEELHGAIDDVLRDLPDEYNAMSRHDVIALSPNDRLIQSVRHEVHVGADEPRRWIRRRIVSDDSLDEAIVYRML